MENNQSTLHELLHTVYLQADAFERHVNDSPAIKHVTPQTKKQVTEITRKLWNLYQAIGEEKCKTNS